VVALLLLAIVLIIAGAIAVGVWIVRVLARVLGG
jgi:hypothetical protein